MQPSLIDKIKQMSIAEQMQLVENLWESILAQPEIIPVTETQKEEIDRRLESHKKSPGEGTSWQEIKSKFQ